MNLKQLLCNHEWERQKIHFTNIFFTYVSDIPTQEMRIYTVKYICNKCHKSETKETYIETGLSDEQRKLLVEETQRYERTLGL